MAEKAVAAVASERRAAWEDDAATGYDGSSSVAEERGPEAVRQIVEQHRAAVSDLSLSTGTTGHSDDAALHFVNDLLTEARTLLGDDDATVLGMMNDTAGLLEMLGRRSSAAPLRRAVFERRRAVHGLTDPSTLHALATLAKLHLTAGGILPGSAPSTASSPLKEPPVTGSPLASSLGAESIGEDAWGAEHLEKLQQELIEARRGVAERDGGSGGGGGGGGEGGGEGGGSADPTLTVIDSLYAALGSIADERGGRKTPADGIRTVGGARAVNHRADGYRAGADIAEHSLQVVPVSAFEREWSQQIAAKKQKVTTETEALAMARCGETYVEVEDSHACVFESFVQVSTRVAKDGRPFPRLTMRWCCACAMQVHYFGKLSVHDSSLIAYMYWAI